MTNRPAEVFKQSACHEIKDNCESHLYLLMNIELLKKNWNE